MTDPSHMGAERLAANMESYLASVEISHEGRGRSGGGLPKSWGNVAAGEEELELGMAGKEEEKVFSLLRPKAYVIMWLTELRFLGRAWYYGNNKHKEVTVKYKYTGGKAVNQGPTQGWKASAQSLAKYKQEQGVEEQEKVWRSSFAGELELERRNTEQRGAGMPLLPGVPLRCSSRRERVKEQHRAN